MTTNHQLVSDSPVPVFESRHFSPPGDEALPSSLGLASSQVSGSSSSSVAAALSPRLSSSVYRFLLESSSSSSVSAAGRPPALPAAVNSSSSSSSSLSVTNLPLSFEDSEQRPFPCKFCDSRFKKKQHLQNHERIHTGEKYMCILCGQGFSRLHILKHHVSRKHSVGEPPSDTAMVQHN